jgi:hypothetical protein
MAESRPQRELFEQYGHRVAARGLQDFPAILPEVWLHWDGQTTAFEFFTRLDLAPDRSDVDLGLCRRTLSN